MHSVFLAALMVMNPVTHSWAQTPFLVQKRGEENGSSKKERARKGISEIERTSSKAAPGAGVDEVLLRSRSAIKQIVSGGVDAIPEIEALLSNPASDERARAVVCEALAAINDERATILLGRVVSDGSQPPMVRASAGRVIVGKKGPGVEAAIKTVVSDKSAPREARAAIMRQVGRLGMDDVDWLAQVARGEGLGLSSDPKMEISQEEFGMMLNAQRALGKSTNPKATEVLIELVREHPSNSLLIQALGKKNDPRSIPVLIAAVKNGSRRALSRHDAVAALGELRATEAMEPLIEIIERERDESLVSAAAVALGKIGDKRALPSLEKLVGNLRDDPRFPPAYWEQAKQGHGYIPPIQAALEHLRR